MIIGITGANDVGKDTVGKIIQYLLYIQNCDSDFNTVHLTAIRFNDYLDNFGIYCNKLPNWQIHKFATKVNESYKLITGIDFHALSREEKEKERPKFIIFDESCKNIFGESVWVDAEFRDYRNFHTDKFSVRQGLSEPEYPNWIFTDVRHYVEFDKIKEIGGIIIHIIKDKPGITDEVINTNFYIENDIISTKIVNDYTIVNNGTIENLILKVKNILIKEKIL